MQKSQGLTDFETASHKLHTLRYPGKDSLVLGLVSLLRLILKHPLILVCVSSTSKEAECHGQDSVLWEDSDHLFRD